MSGYDVDDAGGAHHEQTEPVAESTGAQPVTRPIGAILPDAVDRIRARRLGKEKPIPLPEQWPHLTQALDGGLWPGLYVLVGNTATGKTQFALQAALHAAQTDTTVLYLGLELDELQVSCRLLGLMSSTSWSDLYLGLEGDKPLLADGDLKRYAEQLGRLPFNVQIAPPQGWRYYYMRSAAEQVKREGKPLLVVLDFLQIVGGDDERREDLRQRITNAAYQGRAVARDLDAAVLLLSSTARTNYGTLSGDSRRNNEPALGDGDPGRLIGLGKESGDVEYASDVLLVLARDARTWCAVAKRRAGPPAWVAMQFDKVRGSFVTTDKPEITPVQTSRKSSGNGDTRAHDSIGTLP